MGEGSEDVMAAISVGDADALRELIASDRSLADEVDEAGVSLLLQARYRGETELVEILRAAKAGLSAVERRSKPAAYWGVGRVSW